MNGLGMIGAIQSKRQKIKLAKTELALARANLALGKAFNPMQPRGDDGRWTDEGGGGFGRRGLSITGSEGQTGAGSGPARGVPYSNKVRELKDEYDRIKAQINNNPDDPEIGELYRRFESVGGQLDRTRKLQAAAIAAQVNAQAQGRTSTLHMPNKASANDAAQSKFDAEAAEAKLRAEARQHQQQSQHRIGEKPTPVEPKKTQSDYRSEAERLQAAHQTQQQSASAAQREAFEYARDAASRDTLGERRKNPMRSNLIRLTDRAASITASANDLSNSINHALVTRDFVTAASKTLEAAGSLSELARDLSELPAEARAAGKEIGVKLKMAQIQVSRAANWLRHRLTGAPAAMKEWTAGRGERKAKATEARIKAANAKLREANRRLGIKTPRKPKAAVEATA